MMQSSVVLMARVDDPVAQVTRGTYTTVVQVDHEANDGDRVVDFAIELAPPIGEWQRY
jgi:hypothetical protein